MLFILEILFLIMGIYAVITAKLPSWFVGKGYIAEGNQVRVLGIAMTIPLPLAFCAGLVIGIIDSEKIMVASFIEFIAIIGVAIIVATTLRNIRKPVTPSQVIETKQEQE